MSDIRKFKITGMSCAACSARVEAALSRVAGVDSCSVNLLTSTAAVSGDAADDAIISAVISAGYGAEQFTESRENVNKTIQINRKITLIRRLIVSAVLTLVLMYFSMGYTMLGLPLPGVIAALPCLNGIVQGVLCLAVMIINRKYFINGYKGLIHRAPNMDTLIAMGSLASFVYSVFGTVKTCLLPAAEQAEGLHDLYFESAAMILVLITVGKALEERAKGNTTGAIRALLELSPKFATVERDGAAASVPLEEVVVGDIFILRPGDSVPADGVVIEGESSISEAALTGESIPVDKTVGDDVLAATVNQSGYLKCRAVKVGADTAISSVVRLVEEASASKAPIAKVADRVSGIFVPAVIGISAVTFIIWLILDAGVGFALGRAISVLVVSCPCALGLATPVAVMVGSGVGAKNQILYKSAEALELAGRARIVALDKTGTITSGEPQVVDIVTVGIGDGELISIAYTLESFSEHPLARAIVRYGEENGAVALGATDFKAHAGSGVSAVIEGRHVLGGNLRFVSESCELTDPVYEKYRQFAEEGKTPMLFVSDGRLVGIIAVADTVRDDSHKAIEELREMGMRVVMLTGDNAMTAEAVGRSASVTEVVSDMMPEDKERKIRELSKEGRVIMVGDGINDAPSLVSADVGIAIGGGTDVAIESADVVLMRDALTDVPRAIRLGRQVLRNIYQNLLWAFIYNIVGIPLAAGAFWGLGLELSPMFGALAMSLSSFLVVTNSLRLRGFTASDNKKYPTYQVGEKKGISATRVEKIQHLNENTKEKGEENMTVVFKIDGMMCPHCEARVRATVEAICGEGSATVSHTSGTATVICADTDPLAIKDEIENAGYKVVGYTEK